MSNTESIGIPRQSELARRRHVPDQRRGGDHRRAREVAFAAKAHAVLPVAIERGDRALPAFERVRSLTETGAAPRLTNLASDRPEHVRDRLAAETRVGSFDLMPDTAGPGKDHQLFRGVDDALRTRRANHQCR